MAFASTWMPLLSSVRVTKDSSCLRINALVTIGFFFSWKNFIKNEFKLKKTDVNECNVKRFKSKCDKRTQECINTPGSYYCQCKSGFYESLVNGIRSCKGYSKKLYKTFGNLNNWSLIVFKSRYKRNHRVRFDLRSFQLDLCQRDRKL